jgi:PIN domain nuclease of toxin-antitoxin system
LRLLLDTNVFLWSAFEPGRLSRIARSAVEDTGNTLVVSAVTPWELGIAVNKGRLNLAQSLEEFYVGHFAGLRAVELPINSSHAQVVAGLPLDHRDPFDRMLVAQAIAEGLPIVTNDSQMSKLGATVVW